MEQPEELQFPGFTEWLRGQHGKKDAMGLCLALVFHLGLLSKWRSLPSTYTLYFAMYTMGMIGLFTWRQKQRASYLIWRDAIQVAIRLAGFFLPFHAGIWTRLAHTSPALLQSQHPLIRLGASSLVLAHTLAPCLLVLALARPVGMWLHIPVQALCVGRVMLGMLSSNACSYPFFRTTAAQEVTSRLYQLLQSLHVISLSPVYSHFGVASRRDCCKLSLCWVQLVVGFGVSSCVQAAADLKSLREWRLQRMAAMQRLRERSAAGNTSTRSSSGGGGVSAPTTDGGRHRRWDTFAGHAGQLLKPGMLVDSVHERVLENVSIVCRDPRCWVLGVTVAWSCAGLMLDLTAVP